MKKSNNESLKDLFYISAYLRLTITVLDVLQWVLLNGITDNGINQLMESN